MFKEMLKTFTFGTLYALSAGKNKGIGAVLLYHSINNKDVFYQQMLYLKKKFRFVLAKDIQTEMAKAKKGENFICCTFDDGDLSNYDNALPVLKALDIKATFFIAASLLGKYIERRPMMTIDQVHRLSLMGHEIGAHTMTHPMLTKILIDKAQEEILQSKIYLEKLIGSSVVSFAYPYGDFNDMICGITKDVGFKYGFITKEGLLNSKVASQFKLPRISIEENFNFIHFRSKVSLALEYYELLRGRKL